jgi:hypothetical protein
MEIDYLDHEIDDYGDLEEWIFVNRMIWDMEDD